jgi:hypothetical protein
MNKFTIQQNGYLSQDTMAFYHTVYLGYRRPGNPDYINTLKNTFSSYSTTTLDGAVQNLRTVLLEDLPQILQTLNNPLTVCMVPRAKVNYFPNQLLFKSTTRAVFKGFNNGFCDGTDYITRHTNTKTTHLRNPVPNYNNDGREPYPGITTETCHISNDVRGKDILLIDDLYTRTVNIDEDAIQALLNKGAKSVTFYSVGRTIENRGGF